MSEEEEDEEDAHERREGEGNAPREGEGRGGREHERASANTNAASAPDVPRRATIDRASAGVAPAAATGNPAAAALRADEGGARRRRYTWSWRRFVFLRRRFVFRARASVRGGGRSRGARRAARSGATVAGGVRRSVGATRRAPRTTQRFGEDGVKSRYYRDDDDASLGDLVAAARHGGGEDYDANLAENIAKSSRYKGATTTRARDDAVDDEYDNDEGSGDVRASREAAEGRSSSARRSDRWMHFGDRSGVFAGARTVWTRPSARNTCTWRTGTSRTSHRRTRVDSSRGTASSRRWRTSRAPEPRTRTGEEIRNFKKCLVRMFAAKGMECCFFETATRVGSGVLGAAGARMRRRRSWSACRCPRGGGARARCTSRRQSTSPSRSGPRTTPRSASPPRPPKGLRGAVRPTFPLSRRVRHAGRWRACTS